MNRCSVYLVVLLGLASWCLLVNLTVASSWSLSSQSSKDEAALDSALRIPITPHNHARRPVRRDEMAEGTLRASKLQRPTPVATSDSTSSATVAIGTPTTSSGSVDVDVSVPLATSNEHSQCGLYIAESTIPGAGLGSFTGVAKKEMDPLGYGDVCFPNIDIHRHNPDPVFDPFASYVWSGATMGMTREAYSNDVVAYCPGLDCIINCSKLTLDRTIQH